MTALGLRFLQALAAEATTGCFLEIGPLFGSSTSVIAAGRRNGETIHTIDTFAPAPWIQRRFGFNLDRALFDKFTRHIDNLTVHQGMAPEVVRHAWSAPIGFYFDDATHGDPGWSDNLNFFKPYFQPDAIICGDDFAGGWKDIVRNVYAMADAGGMKAYVIGRVWAMTARDDARILRAIDSVAPSLQGVVLETRNGDAWQARPAAVWSWGLHRTLPLTAARLAAPGEGARAVSGTMNVFAGGRLVQTSRLGQDEIRFEGIDRITLHSDPPLKVQYCVATGNVTENSKAVRSGRAFDIPPGSHVTALRLTEE